jgi:hypothetical protein
MKAYENLEKALQSFQWTNNSSNKGSHKLNYNLYLTPIKCGGTGMQNIHMQTQSLCDKLVIRALERKKEAPKGSTYKLYISMKPYR